MNAAFDFLGMAEACVDLAKQERDEIRLELLDLAEMLLDLADEAVDDHRRGTH
jgi:hypothetical protein